MKLTTKLFAGVLASAAFAAPASAALITGTDSDFSYSFSNSVGGVTVSGSVNVDVTEYNTTSEYLRLLITLTNTTAAGTAGQNRFTAWGFGIGPNATARSFTDNNDGGMIGALFDDMPSNLSQIEVCVYSSNNCNAGSGGLREGGESDTFALRLDFSNLTTAGVTMDPFGARFVSVGANEQSYTFYTPTPPVNVPEPGTLTLLSGGLLALGFMSRRAKLRRRA